MLGAWPQLLESDCAPCFLSAGQRLNLKCFFFFYCCRRCCCCCCVLKFHPRQPRAATCADVPAIFFWADVTNAARSFSTPPSGGRTALLRSHSSAPCECLRGRGQEAPLTLNHIINEAAPVTRLAQMTLSCFYPSHLRNTGRKHTAKAYH